MVCGGSCGSIWLVLLLAGASFTTLQIQNRVRYFLSRPVTVNLRYEHVEEMRFPTVSDVVRSTRDLGPQVSDVELEEMRFPTVTICNENRATYSAAEYFGKLVNDTDQYRRY